MADRVGQQLGNYRLVRLLGQGGFADVYLGEHLYLSSQAAIKVMHTHLAAEEWQSFRKEARLIAGLIHPHIVRLLDFDVAEGVPFLVMQYAPNGTLRQRHTRGNPLAPAVILPYVRQVASALLYVHERRLVHRDIKPENLLIGSENEILLSDFGVAIIAQSSRQQSMQNVGGTVAYMAPEQIQSRPGPASDQYALGVVVYEWLTGERPFDGSFAELASKQVLVPPPALHSRMPTISPEVEAVVLRVLAKDPQERFPSVQAFAQALEEAANADGGATLIARRSYSLHRPLASTSLHLEETSFTTQVLVSARLSSPSAPTAPAASPPLPARRVSRRAVLAAGLTGLALAGGGLTWLALDHQRVTPPLVRHPTATPPPGATPTPIPVGTTLFIYRGHTDAVYTVAWSPDGTQIASGGRDGLARLWDAATGADVFIYRGHTRSVNAVAWSPHGGSFIASGSNDNTVQIWEAGTGRLQQRYSGHSNYVGTLVWSPDGTLIASGSNDTTVQVWEAKTGTLLYTYRGHSAPVKSVDWSPDGMSIASASLDTTVQVWRASDGTPLYRYDGHQQEEVWAVAWSPDGKQIASGGHDGTVQIWQPLAETEVRISPHHTDGVNTLAWSPNGRYVASGSGNTKYPKKSQDTTVQIWDLLDSVIYSYTGHHSVVEAVAWSPDSTRIVSASDDHTARVWVAV